MSIAYLILAHKDPIQLLRLVNAIYNKQDSFVIHVDGTSSLEDFQVLFKEYRNVIFITERCKAISGSYEQIVAILRGLRLIKTSTKTDRIVILSGQDYPIKKLSEIRKFFASNAAQIFMECVKIPCKNLNHGGTWRFPNYDIIKDSLVFYNGSPWISFPVDVIKVIFDYLELNPLFASYFVKVYMPSESFFQTLLMNCGVDEVISKITNAHLYLKIPSKQMFKSEVLSDEDLSLILTSQSLFAKKFETGRSARILNYIDTEILRIKVIASDNEEKPLLFSTNKTKQLISFLTNKDGDEVLNHFGNLHAEVGNLGETKMFFHHENSDQIKAEVQLHNPYFFTSDIFTELGYNPLINSSLDGSSYFPLLKYFREHPNYDYYWYIEDDVYCLMGWDNFFKIFLTENIDCDFLTSHIRDHNQEPDWCWWKSLTFKSSIISDDVKIRSFNPLFRISRNALCFIDQCLSIGWQGHFEVLLPTLLKINGFSIAEFGGVGKYVLPGCENRFYTSTDICRNGSIGNGSMRFRPVISKAEMRLPLIYHPVKSIH